MIINRIRLNYNIKLLDDYFQQKDYENVVKLFQSQEKSPIYYNLAQYAVNKYLTQQNYFDFAPSKFVWISSFDLEDISYLKNFLEFYLPKALNQSSLIEDYKSIFSSTFENLNIKNFPKHIAFDEVVSNSFLHQLIISMYSKKDLIFTSTSAAFFEAPLNKFLIFPQTTLCHFYIIRNPYMLYQRYKDTFKNSQEALNELNDTNEKPNDPKSLNVTVEENRQTWGTNAKSWTNKNVQSTYRGKIIKYEDLLTNPEDTLNEVVYHLKQSGADIDVKFDLIEDFVKNNSLSEIKIDEHSKKESKMVQGALDQSIMDEYDYS